MIASRTTVAASHDMVSRGALLALFVGLMASTLGCSAEKPTTDSTMGLIVFVDLESREPVLDLATTEVPSVNPDTGRRTLMPGLYCPQCQRWHPAPAYDKLQRTPGAATCPTDGTPLTMDGPWLTGDQE